MIQFKRRDITFFIVAVLCFPLLMLVGASLFTALAIVILVGVPLYFFCFLLKLPQWFIAKHRKPSAEITQSREQATDTALAAAQEGIVLLQNQDAALPLPKGTKVNVFGKCSLQSFYNGGGSAASDTSKCTPFVQALQDSGFELNRALLDLQTNYVATGTVATEKTGKTGKKPANGAKVNKGGAEFLKMRPDLTLPEIPATIFTQPGLFEVGDGAAIEQAKDFSDTAVMVIGRGGTEGIELKASELRLGEDEKQLLDLLNGNFAKVILVLNTATPLELGCLAEYPAVRGVVWMGLPGHTGFEALAQILCGEINPSGRLADTWVKNSFAHPAANNFQTLKPDGTWDEKSFHLDNYKDNQGYFLQYSENIYVGYRYFETRACTDAQYVYQNEVLWPFGYGLSYTQFTQKILDLKQEADHLTLRVQVENTGKIPGKEVVQIYSKPPYTEKIEKASVNLVAFGKTEILQPGQTQQLGFSIPLEDLASFDAQQEKCYVLEAGDYEICVMKNAHEAFESRSWQLAEEIVYHAQKAGKRPSDGKAATEQFAVAKTIGEDLTRAWDKTSPAFAGPPAGCYHASDETLKALERPVTTDAEAGLTPADKPRCGAKLEQKLLLSDMVGVPLSDKKWDDFVSQLTIGELCNLCGNGAWHTEKIRRLGVPKRLMPDGSTGVCSTLFSGLVMSNAGEGIIYPSPVVLASMWNPEMARKVGEAVGREAKSMGYHGWYAPAMNCHRTPFNARNFEYYSEDGVLAGKTAARVVCGAQEQGIVCFLKHFALNERESSCRNQLLTYCSEQAIREVYLKPFEIAVKEGGAKGIMTSFNYIGTEWTGADHALLTEVLRGEWGFEGVVSTDACVYPHMDVKKMLVGGGDLSLDSLGGFLGGNIKRVELEKAARDKATQVIITKNLQRAAKNILWAFSSQTTGRTNG